MKKNLRWKALLILAVVVGSTWAFYPPEEKIKLGLDLKGGIHLIMKVNTDDALVAVTRDVADSLSENLDDQSIAFASIDEVEPGKLAVEGLDPNPVMPRSGAPWIRTFPAWDVRSLGGWRLGARDASGRRSASSRKKPSPRPSRRSGGASTLSASPSPSSLPTETEAARFSCSFPASTTSRAPKKSSNRRRSSSSVSSSRLGADPNRRPEPGTEILPGEPDEGGNIDLLPVGPHPGHHRSRPEKREPRQSIRQPTNRTSTSR